MNKLIDHSIEKRIHPDRNTQHSAKCRCNYPDNYYGDQTCTHIKHSDAPALQSIKC